MMQVQPKILVISELLKLRKAEPDFLMVSVVYSDVVLYAKMYVNRKGEGIPKLFISVHNSGVKLLQQKC